VYGLVDCNGDRVLDHVCMGPNQKRGALISGTGRCDIFAANNAPATLCPAFFSRPCMDHPIG
jgi:hypothetical protein